MELIVVCSHANNSTSGLYVNMATRIEMIFKADYKQCFGARGFALLYLDRKMTLYLPHRIHEDFVGRIHRRYSSIIAVDYGEQRTVL